MSTRTVTIRSVVAAFTLLAGLGGVVAGVAQASPSSTITVQDQDNKHGAAVDTDGTQGDFHRATQGTTSGPIIDAVPQFKAK